MEPLAPGHTAGPCRSPYLKSSVRLEAHAQGALHREHRAACSQRRSGGRGCTSHPEVGSLGPGLTVAWGRLGASLWLSSPHTTGGRGSRPLLIFVLRPVLEQR